MKIGIVCPYNLEEPGGVQEHVKALYQQFGAKGHEVLILAPGDSLSRGKRVGDVIKIGAAAPVLPSIANDSSGNINFFLDTQDKIKKVLEKEDFDLLHFHSPMLPLLSWQILSESKAVNVATFHENIDEDEGEKAFKILLKSFSPITKSVGRALDASIAVSESAARLVDQVYKIKVDAVIPNGVDLRRFNPSNEPLEKFKDGKFNILFVGRLDPRKGAIYLIRAFQKVKEKHPNSRLIIVGPGEDRATLEELVVADRLKDVVFEGFVKGGVLPRYYASADLYCSPATHSESFGIVLLEAMASGTPLVAFDNSGYRDVLTGKGADCLVENKNVEALAEKINLLIENAEKRKELREWGLEESKNYSWDKVSDQVLEFYEQAIEMSRSKVSVRKKLTGKVEEFIKDGKETWSKVVPFSNFISGTLTDPEDW